jgi:hypothetical protein
MAFAPHVLDQINFTGADDPGLSIARRNLVRRVQIDDVLSPGRWVPVKKPVRRGGAKNNAGRGKYLRDGPVRSCVSQLDFDIAEMGFPFSSA